MAKFSDIQQLIIDSTDTFAKGLEKTGTFAFRLAKRRITSDMDVNFPTASDSPHLIRSEKNETLAGDISNNLLNAMFTDSFNNRLNTFAAIPKEINNRTLQYYRDNFGEPTPETIREAQAKTVQCTQIINQAMAQNSLYKNIFEPAVNAMYGHIAQGSTVNATLSDMQTRINDRFVSYLRPLGRSLLQACAREVNNVYADSFKLVWVSYKRRPADADRRDFCVAHESRLGNNPTHYHVDEVKQEWTGFDGGNWAGMIDGTSSQNILTYAGGYNCLHYYQYVEAKNVSASDKARARSKGYI